MSIYNKFLILLLSIVFHKTLSAQGSVKQLDASEIYEELEKFNFLGTALYVAAHPDDENTRLISYLSNGLHARTAYLSLTRGDGGQNLIGTEIRELLGVLRSQELQMARATDGGQQFFTRANDFGYSKHPDETLKIWNKDKVMEDILYVIRTFKPDIIVNRFDHRTPGRTHGHHTSSAMLSMEAFDLSNDPTVYPNQAKEYGTWQPTRLFMNTSWWFYGGRDKFAEADKSHLVPVDAGVYYPSRGISNNEIASLARSKHRSQGFGSAGGRGSQMEWLEPLKGEELNGSKDLFDGVNTSWSRVKGGQQIKDKMAEILETYDFRNPSKSVPDLLAVHDLLQNIQDPHWKPIKEEHLNNIIAACTGLHIEASAEAQQATTGDSTEVTVEVTNRSDYHLQLQSVHVNQNLVTEEKPLETNTQNKWFHKVNISDDLKFSNPYWLDQKGELGIYSVEDPLLRTTPQSPGALSATFNILVEGRLIEITKEVNYRYVDPAQGEIRQPFVVIPPATLSFDKEMYLFANDDAQSLTVNVRAGKDALQGTLTLEVPDGWSVAPQSVEVDVAIRSQEKGFAFELKPPKSVSESYIKASIVVDGNSHNKNLINIDYDHIPLQTILLPSESKIVKVPMQKGGQNIGYLMGAGDKMPECLTNVGYNISLLEVDALTTTNLDQYDAVVIGIRAYNTLSKLKLYNAALFDYAERGGTLITQYNTSRRLNFEHLSPYPLKLSRKRVTDEYAEIRIINPEHKVMNTPNKITSADFDNWVQERGLYFPEEWDEKYEPIISCNDKGEDPLDGSLLIAEHGNGHIVYSSISWFRQLPAGVPGAYRIFANMLALSSDNKRP